jgi:hypothetical protein
MSLGSKRERHYPLFGRAIQLASVDAYLPLNVAKAQSIGEQDGLSVSLKPLLHNLVAKLVISLVHALANHCASTFLMPYLFGFLIV